MFLKNLDFFSKTAIGLRLQLILNYESAQKSLKKVYQSFKNKKINFSLILNRLDELFAYKIVLFLNIAQINFGVISLTSF